MKYHYFIKFIALFFILMCLQGCPPTQTHEETVTLPVANIKTLNETATSDNVCRNGTAPDQPGPGQFITGFFHYYNNDDDCWTNQIYQGLIRFQIDAAPFYKRLIKSATLNLHAANVKANPPQTSCIARMALTDIQWWALSDTGRIHLSDLRDLRSVPSATDIKVDVTQEVQHWANGTDQNNGFVFIGSRPEMSDFSNTGMLTNETCEGFYDDASLTVTFFQFNNGPIHPSITVHAVHTQTTTDVTVVGSGFTPNGTVNIFADDLTNRMGSFPLGNVTADSNGQFQFFNRALCTRQPDSGNIRALDSVSGDNVKSYLTVFCD
jgi:hypothetical protein